jgi:hypothetical protein
MIADRQLKLKTNEPLFFINIPTPLEYADISPNFSSFLKKLHHSFFHLPPEIKNKIASSLLKTKLIEEIASTLNKIQSKHKQNKTLLDLQDLHLAFQLKNELIPKLKTKIKNEKMKIRKEELASLPDNIIYQLFHFPPNEKYYNYFYSLPKIKNSLYQYFASLLELYALDKLSKTYNLIAYITNLSTPYEIQKQINLLKKEKINFKCFTINLDHIITSIERKNLFYIFIKDKMFATIYAPMLQ